MNHTDKRIIDILSGKIYVVSVFKYAKRDLEYCKCSKQLYNKKQIRRIAEILTYKRTNGFLKSISYPEEYMPAYFQTPQKTICVTDFYDT